MISCALEVSEDIDELHRIFLAERLESSRATCRITKGRSLVFRVKAKDPVAMKALLTSILKTIEIYNKTRDLK